MPKVPLLSYKFIDRVVKSVFLSVDVSSVVIVQQPLPMLMLHAERQVDSTNGIRQCLKPTSLHASDARTTRSEFGRLVRVKHGNGSKPPK